MPEVKGKKQERLAEMNDYADLADRLIKQKKAEIGDAEQRLTLIKSEARKLQESMVKEQGFTEQRAKDRERKFDSETSTKRNELIARDYKLTENEKLVTRKLVEVEARENRVLVLEDERKQIAQSRIEVEKLFNQANSAVRDGIHLREESDNRLSIAVIAEKEAKELLGKNNSILASINADREKLESLDKSAGLREKNIKEAREAIDPKIEELKILEDRQRITKQELTERENKIQAKLEEDSLIIASLDAREKRCKEKELELTQKEEEILRKSLLLNK